MLNERQGIYLRTPIQVSFTSLTHYHASIGTQRHLAHLPPKSHPSLSPTPFCPMMLVPMTPARLLPRQRSPAPTHHPPAHILTELLRHAIRLAMQFVIPSWVRLEMAVFFRRFKYIVETLRGGEGRYFVGVAVAKPERAGEAHVVVLDEAAMRERCEVGGSFLDGVRGVGRGGER